jgi:hypothetical protein
MHHECSVHTEKSGLVSTETALSTGLALIPYAMHKVDKSYMGLLSLLLLRLIIMFHHDEKKFLPILRMSLTVLKESSISLMYRFDSAYYFTKMGAQQ